MALGPEFSSSGASTTIIHSTPSSPVHHPNRPSPCTTLLLPLHSHAPSPLPPPLQPRSRLSTTGALPALSDQSDVGKPQSPGERATKDGTCVRPLRRRAWASPARVYVSFSSLSPVTPPLQSHGLCHAPYPPCCRHGHCGPSPMKRPSLLSTSLFAQQNFTSKASLISFCLV